MAHSEFNFHNYVAPTLESWTGRVDFPQSNSTARWHQLIKILDLKNPSPAAPKKINFALLGFASDEGVRRNLGKPGAALGPMALRQSLTNLPAHDLDGIKIFDAGDVVCDDGNLEASQNDLAHAVQKLLSLGYVPLVLGGGHETAYGHGLGILKNYDKAKRAPKIGIVNFDAHFDLRPDTKGATSGTPFLQLAREFSERKKKFSYFCAGIHHACNTKHLFETAKKLDVEFATAKDFHDPASRLKTRKKLKAFVKKQDLVYLTFCLDALAAAFAPGVSAPTPLGLIPHDILDCWHDLAASGKVAAFDVVELCPPLDSEGRTAKLAAHFIFEFISRYKAVKSIAFSPAGR